MDFDSSLPLKLLLNAGHREQRRSETEAHLEEVGIHVERFPALPPRDAEGSPANIAPPCFFETRRALREAGLRGAPAVLVLEDDLTFHANFHALACSVDLPEDWGVLFLGCTHDEKPEWVGRRLVRIKRALAGHALAVRAPYYKTVRRALRQLDRQQTGTPNRLERLLAHLGDKVPMYSCYPNLAWKATLDSDQRKMDADYTRDGRQTRRISAIAELLSGLTTPPPPDSGASSMRSAAQPSARLGLLFLTRADVNHPRIWDEFVSEAPERVRVLSHPKSLDGLKGGFLEGTAIRERHETRWGDISLVRASRSMLLEALEDASLTHFVLLSESCVPVRPLPEILRRLELDPRPQFSFRTLAEANPRHVSRIGAVPYVPSQCWRFTSQWWLLDRVAAVFAAAQDHTLRFAGMFVPDEAYFATMLTMQGYPLEGGVIKNDITWSWWEKDAGSPTEWLELPTERLEQLLHSGTFFARKFPKGSDIGRFSLHRSPHLLSPGPIRDNPQMRVERARPASRQ